MCASAKPEAIGGQGRASLPHHRPQQPQAARRQLERGTAFMAVGAAGGIGGGVEQYLPAGAVAAQREDEGDGGVAGVAEEQEGLGVLRAAVKAEVGVSGAVQEEAEAVAGCTPVGRAHLAPLAGEPGDVLEVARAAAAAMQEAVPAERGIGFPERYHSGDEGAEGLLLGGDLFPG